MLAALTIVLILTVPPQSLPLQYLGAKFTLQTTLRSLGLGTTKSGSGSGKYLSLSERLHLTVDGRTVRLPPSLEGIVILNLPSFAGGLDMWPHVPSLAYGSSGTESATELHDSSEYIRRQSTS